MKYKTMRKLFLPLDLQLFAGTDDGGDGGSDGDDAGGDDQGGDDDPDEDGDDDSAEKKYTEEEMEAAVKSRLAREKRKWQRSQKKQQDASGGKDSGKDDSGKDGGKDDKETQELQAKAAKAEELELKWACLEHDVDKSCVDDVLALARVHMAKDEDMDIEDAIDEVLKKYPQFKASAKSDDGADDEEEQKGKAWGQRQNGRKKKTSGVEAEFLKKNPGLKID